MRKEMIIDDVDVAECEHRSDTHNTLLADGTIKKFSNYCHITNDGCYGVSCYYKQLKRLEQENKELKELKCKFKEYCTCDTERLQAENEELKHRCEIYHQCDEMIKNTYGQAHKKAMRLTKENELIKRLLNDILRIFNLGQYDFLKDQNEIIMALERAIQRDKDFFEFVELRQENELLNEKVETLDKMTGIYSARLCKKYKQALEEIREYLQQFKKKKSNFYTLNDVVTDIASNIEKRISEVLK